LKGGRLNLEIKSYDSGGMYYMTNRITIADLEALSEHTHVVCPHMIEKYKKITQKKTNSQTLSV
jgi:hypothetical protein